jgi:hypothetical protein
MITVRTWTASQVKRWLSERIAVADSVARKVKVDPDVVDVLDGVNRKLRMTAVAVRALKIEARVTRMIDWIRPRIEVSQRGSVRRCQRGKRRLPFWLNLTSRIIKNRVVGGEEIAGTVAAVVREDPVVAVAVAKEVRVVIAAAAVAAKVDRAETIVVTTAGRVAAVVTATVVLVATVAVARTAHAVAVEARIAAAGVGKMVSDSVMS